MKKVIIILILLILILIYYFYKPEWRNSGNLIGKRIPYSSKILESYDTHGGFHGDGEYYVVFQLTNEQYKKFLKDVFVDSNWEKMPLSNDIQKISYWFSKGEHARQYELPLDTPNGLYYFRDFQHSKKPIWDRNSVNFVISILDIRNERLFICRVDS